MSIECHLMADADTRVATSLYAKALAGDTVACIVWLKDRQKLQWRDNQEVEHRDRNGGAIELQELTSQEAMAWLEGARCFA